MAGHVKTDRAIDDALHKNGLSDPREILRGLAQVVGRHHTETVGFDRVGCFRDGLEPATGKQAVSYADGLRNYTEAVAAMHESIATYRRSIGERDSAENHAHRAAQLRGLADFLVGLLPSWEDEGEDLKAKGFTTVTMAHQLSDPL